MKFLRYLEQWGSVKLKDLTRGVRQERISKLNLVRYQEMIDGMPILASWERRIKRRAEIRHQTRFQRKQSKIQSGGDNFGGKYMELNYSVVTRNI